MTRKGKFIQWFTSKGLSDQVAAGPLEWPVNAFMEDRLFEKYGNRKVNIEVPVAKERNAENIIIQSDPQLLTPINLQIAVNDYHFSEFFAEMFTIVFAMWMGISLLVIIQAYRTYGERIERKTGIIGKLKNVVTLGMNNFDQFKDL